MTTTRGRRKRKRGGRRRSCTFVKIRNPHLAGGEKQITSNHHSRGSKTKVVLGLISDMV